MPFINRCGDAPKLQTKTVNPTHAAQTVTPDAGFDAMEKVVINAPTFQTKTVTTDGTFTPDDGYTGMSSVVVNAPRSAYFTYAISPTNKQHSLEFNIGDYLDCHGRSPSSIILYHNTYCPNVTYTGGSTAECDSDSMKAAYLTKYDNNHYIGYVYQAEPSDAQYDADKSGETPYNPRTTITADDEDTDKVLVSYDMSSKKVTVNFKQLTNSKYNFYFIESTTKDDGASRENSVYYAMFLWGNQNGG